jgi:CelD/BcsL family acetyltransferase involved in cellulose biosynthesis
MLRGVTFEHGEQARAVWSRWDELAVLRSRPYCCPAWMMAWWEHVAPRGARLRIIAAFDDADLVGIAPLFSDHGFGGLNRYRLLGVGTSSPLDILARPGMEEAVGLVVVQTLAEADPRPDVIMLEGVPGDSPWPRLLCDLWPGPRKLGLRRQFSQPAPFVELSGTTYAHWFASRKAKFRNNMRRGLKQLQRHGATVRLSTDREELTREVEALAGLHRLRWGRRGRPGALDAQVERMLVEAGARLIEQGRFRLWSIHLDGRPISSQLLVSAGGRTACWLGGFDEAETRVRWPGSLIILSALEHAFSVGDGRFDLGSGGQSYKYDFSQTADSVEWALLIAPGWRSFLARAQLAPLRARVVLAQRASPRAKRVLRRALEWRGALRSKE